MIDDIRYRQGSIDMAQQMYNIAQHAVGLMSDILANEENTFSIFSRKPIEQIYWPCQWGSLDRIEVIVSLSSGLI